MAQFKNREEYEKWKAERGKKPATVEAKPDVNQKPIPNPTTKKCTHCAIDIPSKARVCFSCRKEQMTPTTALATIAGAAIVFFLLISSQCSKSKTAPQPADIVASNQSQSSSKHIPDQPSIEHIPGEIDACVFSQMMVRNLLKSPSTADFGPCNSRPKGTGYSIASYVDSQNSFGAKLRTAYAWDGHYYNKEWKTDFLALGSKTLIADGKIVAE